MEVELTGVHGEQYFLEGPRVEDVELRPGPKQLIDAPVRTFWLQGAQRMHYQGFQFERRDPIFSLNICGSDPDHWRWLDSQVRLAFGFPDDQFRITVRTPDSERWLDLRMLSTPTAWETAEWEKGKDPHLIRTSTLLINAAAEVPFWQSEDWVKEWEVDSTNWSETFLIENPGDIEVWPKYFLPAPGQWQVSDKSFGQEWKHQRKKDIDLDRMAPPFPTLLPGEDLDVDSDPDEELMIAANEAPVWARYDGNDLMYPVPGLTPETEWTISGTGLHVGDGVKMTLPRRYSRPLGVSL